MVRFQILTDDQTKLVFEVKKDAQGKNFLLELNKAIGGELIFQSIKKYIINKYYNMQCFTLLVSPSESIIIP